MAPSRATAPVVAVCALVALTALLAAGVGTLAVAVEAPTDRASVTLSATAATDRLVLTHRGGDPLDVAALDVAVEVEGEALAHQPPVPFFAAPGFRSGPTGPFNSASSDRWTAGDRTTLRLASTNDPRIESGDEVTVTLRRGGYTVAVATDRAS